jgi:serine protease Do
MNDKLHKTKKVILFGLVIFLVGGFGSLIIEKYVAPYLATRAVFNKIGFLHTNSPIVITRTEQIRVNESVSLRNLVKQLTPNVVTIVGGHGNFDQSFKPLVRATGLIISSDGVIATDNSVLSDKKNNYWAITVDGTAYAITPAAVDPTSGLALVKITANNLSPVKFGNSTELEAGQQLAVLSASNLANSVRFKSSYVSAASGDLGFTDVYSSEQAVTGYALDTTPEVGAGVFNLLGQLVGIGGANGRIVPAESLKSAEDSYFQNTTITRATLGINYEVFSGAGARLIGSNAQYGIVLAPSTTVPAVMPGSRAQKAGLLEGDIITQIDSQSISASQPLGFFLNKAKSGDTWKLTVIRAGKQMEVSVTLGELK